MSSRLLLAGLLLTSAGRCSACRGCSAPGRRARCRRTDRLSPGDGACRAGSRLPGQRRLVAALVSAPEAVVLVVAALFLHLPGWWLQRRGEAAAWAIDGVSLGVAGVARCWRRTAGWRIRRRRPSSTAAAAFLLLSVRRPGEVLPAGGGGGDGARQPVGACATLPGRPGGGEWRRGRGALFSRRFRWRVPGGTSRRTPHASGAAGLLAGLLAVGFALTAPRPLYEYHLTGTLTLLSAAVLVPAVWRRDPWWFTAFQTGVTLAVVAGVTAAGRGRDWVGELPQVQAYGVALAALAAAWGGGRKALAGRPGWERVFTAFTPGIDEITIGFGVLGLLLLAAGERGSGWRRSGASPESRPRRCAYAEGGVAVAGGRRQSRPVGMLLGPGTRGELPRRRGALFCLMLLGVTTALEATTHANDLATATALRLEPGRHLPARLGQLWGRERLDRVATTMRLVGAPVGDPLVGLLGVVAVIVLLMTAILVGQGFEGVVLPGPLATSVYARMGTLAASLGPVVLVIVALVGSAVSERSPGCAGRAKCLPASACSAVPARIETGGRCVPPEHPLAGRFPGLGRPCRRRGGVDGRAGGVGEDGLLSVAAWLGLAVVFVTMLVLAPRLLLTVRAAGGGPLGLPGCGVAALALVLSAATAWWHATVRARDGGST
ncbi:MAG: hypothetical protein U0736_20450 [Gemmataceae bacterium]